MVFIPYVSFFLNQNPCYSYLLFVPKIWTLFVCFLMLRQQIKSIDMFKLDWDDFAHAHSDLNL